MLTRANGATYWLAVKPFGTFFHIYSAANGPVDRKDVQRFLLQALALGNGIADMFTFDEIGEEDLEIVTGCWSFGLEGSREAIRTRIQHLASVAIRSGSGNLAGFAMMNHDGMIIGVNVLPEYRGQRLRDALFAKLAHQTHAKFGYLTLAAVRP
ncbi:unnamed protein product, partial [Mesorhabditis spiculigera]